MNTDKQPQKTKTANEFLFEYGINTMSLNDDFNCQLLFAMERYAEYYASHQKDIKIDDKVVFNYTDKQPQTVYVPTKNKSDFKILDPNFGTVNAYVKTGYFHTHEELQSLKVKWQREAAEKGWDSANEWEKYNKFVNFDPGPNFKEYWKGLIPTDKEIYLNTHYHLPKPPKQ